MSNQGQIILIVAFVLGLLFGGAVLVMGHPYAAICTSVGVIVLVTVCLSACMVGARADRHAGEDK